MLISDAENKHTEKNIGNIINGSVLY